MKRNQKRASAFVMALIALAVLTVVGLSLAMVTETEMALGETEKVINEGFYANEGGSTTQISTLLATNGLEGINVVFPSQSLQNSRANITVGYDVVSSGLAPVATDELPYTKVNEGKGDKLYAFFYHTKTLARRTAWSDKLPVPTCTDISTRELGRSLTQNGFYYAPAGKLPDTALITMSELDDPGSSSMTGVLTSNSSCYGNIFADVGGATGATY